jgi:nicotinate-nucleotide adenylyltransferase
VKLGLFGGGFNPPHQGHLMIARNAWKQAGLDRVLFIPCAVPPHKSSESMVSGEHRIVMTRLAIETEALDAPFDISTWELERGGVSYAIDTVRHMRGAHPGASLHFIIGSDNFEILPQWFCATELIGLCEFLVIHRPGCPPVRSPTGFSLNYEVVEGPTLEVSSSDVRRWLREGKDVTPFLSPPVIAYIRRLGLYGVKTST